MSMINALTGYTHAAVVTPHATNAMPFAGMRALWIGGAGTVTLQLSETQTTGVLFSGIPAGTLLPIACVRVFATGTTATLIVALS